MTEFSATYTVSESPPGMAVVASVAVDAHAAFNRASKE